MSAIIIIIIIIIIIQFYYYYYYYYYYYLIFSFIISLLLLLFTPLEFFTSVLADGFSLEFEWQQDSSSLQDSCQDSGRS